MALLITGILELADTAFEEIIGAEVGAGHGILLYAMSETGRVLHKLFEDIESASEVALAIEVSDDSKPDPS